MEGENDDVVVGAEGTDGAPIEAPDSEVAVDGGEEVTPAPEEGEEDGDDEEDGDAPAGE